MFTNNWVQVRSMLRIRGSCKSRPSTRRNYSSPPIYVHILCGTYSTQSQRADVYKSCSVRKLPFPRGRYAWAPRHDSTCQLLQSGTSLQAEAPDQPRVSKVGRGCKWLSSLRERLTLYSSPSSSFAAKVRSCLWHGTFGRGKMHV